MLAFKYAFSKNMLLCVNFNLTIFNLLSITVVTFFLIISLTKH